MSANGNATQSARLASLPNEAHNFVEGIQALLAEKDACVHENRRLQTDLALAEQRCSDLQNRLRTISAERDHSMRFIVELVTQLNTVQSILGEATKNAEHATYRPNDPTPGKTSETTLTPEQEAGLKRIVARATNSDLS